MKRYPIYAVGKDPYWLQAVARIADETITVELIPWSVSDPECLNRLPEAEAEALLLVDATGQDDLVAVAQQLYERGWRYVVIVAADPSSKEAHAVFWKARGYDYWKKTYVHEIIRRSIEQWLASMRQAAMADRR